MPLMASYIATVTIAYKRPAFGVPTLAARTACIACSAQRVTAFSAHAG
jgi:hypothetical protein